MQYYIGIDLGTSGVKTLLLGSDGTVLSSVTKDYSLFFPQPGWSEQNPQDWYTQTIAALKELCATIDPQDVRAVSFSGQMHGLVLLDENNRVIRPAILWNDGRSSEETEMLNAQRNFLLDHTGNIAFAGFTLPKLLWVQKHEPDLFKQIRHVLLPKDYLAFRLTGSYCTDVSDASGTLYFDVAHRCWSKEILSAFGVDERWLPQVLESDETAGMLLPELAAQLGMKDVSVVIGAGDNAAAAVGTGAVKDGDCNLSLGTSGTVFCVSDSFQLDRAHAIHSFCSASRSYHQMACMLSAAVCSNWWVKQILNDSFASVMQKEDRLGKNDVWFLPYLMGERSPLNDTEIRGLFYGMSLQTDKDDMSLAVLEGVSFALRHNVDLIRDMGIPVQKATVCGGGAKDALWLRILANVLGVTLSLPVHEEGASLGAAMLAAKGVLAADSFFALEQRVYAVARTIEPEEALTKLYEAKYQQWRRLYPAIKQAIS